MIDAHLGVVAVVDKTALLLPEHVVVAVVLGEAPVTAHHDLLATGELELGTTHGLLGLQFTCARVEKERITSLKSFNQTKYTFF